MTYKDLISKILNIFSLLLKKENNNMAEERLMTLKEFDKRFTLFKNIPQSCIWAIEMCVNKLESGFDKVWKDPDDIGGTTKGGIAKRYYPYLDIENLTKEQIIRISYTDFYTKYEDIQNEIIRHFIYWSGYNFGNGYMRSTFQKYINEMIDMFSNGEKYTYVKQFELKVDGVLGPKTNKALEAILDIIRERDSHHEERIAIYALSDFLITRWRTRATAWKHFPGWMNRLHKQFVLLSLV